MVEDATRALEPIADESWIPWASRLIPKVAHQVRIEAEARVREEQSCKLQEEVKHLADKKLARATKWDRQLKEKLMAVLEGLLTQVELEVDLEVEEMGEVEESEAVGMEEVGTTGGTQSSVMEVDEEGEDEVVVVEEAKRGETRKRAPSSLLKTLRKRVHAAMAMQLSVGSQGRESSVQGSQVGSSQVGGMERPCWRCVKHRTQCIMMSSDEPPHQIRSYTLLFSLFLHFPYITDPPLHTSAPTQLHVTALALA